MGKRILLTTFILAGILTAGTFHTIAMNGTNNFLSDETFTTSTDTITAYCTWDANYLYLAYTADFLSSANDTVRGTTDMFWYIDTDPHPENPLSGNGTDKAATYWTNIMEQQPFWFEEQSWTLPFYADYFVRGDYVKQDSVYGRYGPYNASTGSWDAKDLDTSLANLNMNQSYYEVAVPWDSLAYPAHIYIVGWLVSNEWESDIYWVDFVPHRDLGGTYGSWPAQSLEGGDGDKNENGKFNHWFSFEITGGVSPNLVNDPPVVSAIADQSISEGESFTNTNLNDYVFDDLTPDSSIQWTFSGNSELAVTIDANNQAAVATPDSNWTGSETITYTAEDEGGKKDSTSVTYTVNGPSVLLSDLSGLPETFSVSQNYPNPFNPATRIKFGLHNGGAVKIQIFNILGQEVFVFQSAFLPAGFHTYTFNGENYISGTYFYRVSTKGQTIIKKMTLLK